jgi:hypothetical protein
VILSAVLVFLVSAKVSTLTSVIAPQRNRCSGKCNKTPCPRCRFLNILREITGCLVVSCFFNVGCDVFIPFEHTSWTFCCDLPRSLGDGTAVALFIILRSAVTVASEIRCVVQIKDRNGSLDGRFWTKSPLQDNASLIFESVMSRCREGQRFDHSSS